MSRHERNELRTESTIKGKMSETAVRLEQVEQIVLSYLRNRKNTK